MDHFNAFSTNWKTASFYRRPLWRVVRDWFDDTAYLSQAKVIRKRNKKNFKAITSIQVEPKSIEYIKSTEIEDYAAVATEDVQVITVPVKTPYFIPVPIRSYGFKLEHKGRKQIVINLDKYMPKIKFKMRNLKRLALVSAISCCLIVILCSLFIGYRIISVTDGDFFGETFQMRLAKYQQDTITPIHANIDDIKSRLNKYSLSLF